MSAGGATLKLRLAGESRAAPHHALNEDAWSTYAMPSGRSALLVVCDGVSTAGAGAPAAQLACRRVGQFFDKGTRRHPDTLAQLVSEIDWALRGAGRQARFTLAMAWVDGGPENAEACVFCFARETTKPEALRNSTLSRVRIAQSPSSRYVIVSVKGASASASEPRNISPSP